MKQIFAVLFFLALGLSSNAQKTKQYEIGVGIGYLEFNPYSYQYLSSYDRRWTYNSVFKQSLYRNGMFSLKGQRVTRSYATPSVYGSLKMAKRVLLRSSFQYAYEKGQMSYNLLDEVGEPGIFHFELKQRNLTTGISFEWLRNKYLHAYVASDVEMIYSNISQTTVGFFNGSSEGWDCFIIPPHIIEGSNIKSTVYNFYLNQALGFEVPLSKVLNIKYEFSARLVEQELKFRPINRLSINATF